MAVDNTTLGKFHLTGLHPAPKGMVQIEVTFDIDTNGILHVTAKDLGTGKKQDITITSHVKLSEGQISRMREETEKIFG